MKQEKQIRRRRLTKAQRRRRRRIRRIMRTVCAMIVLALALLAAALVWRLLAASDRAEKATADISAEMLPEPTGIEVEYAAEENGEFPASDPASEPTPHATAIPVGKPRAEHVEDGEMPMVVDPDEIVPTTAVQVAVSMNRSAWISDGKIHVTDGDHYTAGDVSGWQSVLQISLSDGHIVAVDDKGCVLAAGLNGSGQCDVNGLQGVAYAAAGLEYTVCVMRDGTVYLSGAADPRIRSGLESCRNALLADVSASHAVVLHGDGTVSAFGAGTYGECNVENWRNVQSVSAGDGFTVALTQNGEILFCGNNSYGQKNAVQWKNIAAVEAGSSYIVAIGENGTMYTIGRNGQGQCELDDWRDIAAVAAGYDHTVGLTADGKVLAAGYNGGGQCDVY